MLTSELNYFLPQDAIALYPPKIRGDAKLLAINSQTLSFEVLKYADLAKIFTKDDCIVLNDTMVFKARLICKKETGGMIEIFLQEKHGAEDELKAIVSGSVYDDQSVEVVDKDGQLTGQFVKFLQKKENFWIVACTQELLEMFGHTPIPPYLKRQDTIDDLNRYQSVSAKVVGSVAAPTASLNFTQELKLKLAKKNIPIEYLTLHCGYGTFNPIKAEDTKDHKMHSEWYKISEPLLKVLKSEKKSIVAVGTTVARALETFAQKLQSNSLHPESGEADIFLTPGSVFFAVDKLVTNFHAPRSTPLFLATAFLADKLLKHGDAEGVFSAINFILKSYDFALKNNFKFLSYGDSMVIF